MYLCNSSDRASGRRTIFSGHVDINAPDAMMSSYVLVRSGRVWSGRGSARRVGPGRDQGRSGRVGLCLIVSGVSDNV